jgi:hypothetical protein
MIFNFDEYSLANFALADNFDFCSIDNSTNNTQYLIYIEPFLQTTQLILMNKIIESRAKPEILSRTRSLAICENNLKMAIICGCNLQGSTITLVKLHTTYVSSPKEQKRHLRYSSETLTIYFTKMS